MIERISDRIPTTAPGRIRLAERDSPQVAPAHVHSCSSHAVATARALSPDRIYGYHPDEEQASYWHY